MNTINASNLFMFPEQHDNIITLLRSVTTYMLLEKNILSLSSIQLKPLYDNKKYISIVQDQNKDHFYLEHLSSFKIQWWKSDTKIWTITAWKKWVYECIHVLKMYPSIQKVVVQFYQNEIESCFKKSSYQIQQLKKHNVFFEKEMIESWFFMKRECHENITEMLDGHIDALSIIYKQISSSEIKKNIAKDIFSIVEIYSNIIAKSLDDSNKFNTIIIDFKKEVNKTISNYVNFVKTDKINFRWWLLSLYQFILSCDLVSFDITKSIIRLNMIFFFVFPVDTIKKYPQIHVNNKKITNTNMVSIHPFMRGIYSDQF